MLYHFARNKEAALKARASKGSPAPRCHCSWGAGRPRSVLANKILFDLWSMKQRTHFAQAAFLLFSTAVATQAWAATETTLSGIVTDGTGKPVAHAGIVLKGATGNDAGNT